MLMRESLISPGDARGRRRYAGGMTSIPEQPDGPDLDELRKDIDELKEKSTEELIEPQPSELLRDEPEPERTDAIGSEKWDEPGDEERTEV